MVARLFLPTISTAKAGILHSFTATGGGGVHFRLLVDGKLNKNKAITDDVLLEKAVQNLSFWRFWGVFTVLLFASQDALFLFIPALAQLRSRNSFCHFAG
jgi:hypothetical protein